MILDEKDMNEVVEQVKNVYVMMSDKGLCEALAVAYKEIHQALMTQGFTDDQSVLIMSNMNIGQGK